MKLSTLKLNKIIKVRLEYRINEQKCRFEYCMEILLIKIKAYVYRYVVWLVRPLEILLK